MQFLRVVTNKHMPHALLLKKQTLAPVRMTILTAVEAFRPRSK